MTIAMSIPHKGTEQVSLAFTPLALALRVAMGIEHVADSKTREMELIPNSISLSMIQLESIEYGTLHIRNLVSSTERPFWTSNRTYRNSTVMPRFEPDGLRRRPREERPTCVCEKMRRADLRVRQTAPAFEKLERTRQ
jgi:hypothetical protein